MQRTAVEAAVGQASLRKGLNQVFVSLDWNACAETPIGLLGESPRIGLLDDMELATSDSSVLADLFRLDHLTTRMRRHAEGMAYKPTEPAGAREAPAMPSAVKILVAGGFGAGKTTLVGAISEIRPLSTEEDLSDQGVGVDDVSGVEGKTTTTVAMDFGRMALRAGLNLYLFGTPGQERFWFMWDELAQGSIGAVVLADTRRLSDCFAAIDYFEQRETPFLVAVNQFGGSPEYTPEEVTEALDLAHGTPVVLCDARRRESVRHVLVELVKYAIRYNRAVRERAGAS